MIRLFHFTSHEAAGAILSNGFDPTDGSPCWFTPAPATVAGEQTRQVLLEVVHNFSDPELEKYVQSVVEEELDQLTGEVVIESEYVVPPYNWYCIPAAVVNAHTRTRRVVPPDERKARVEGFWDDEA